MKKMFALIAVAGLAAVASAQPTTGLFKWEVSKDGGATWSSSATVNGGDAYKIRASASWTDGATASVGFAGATFEQIDLANANATDTFGGAQGPGGVPTYAVRKQGTTESWSLQLGTGASAGGMKIDNTTAGARTNFGQLPKVLPGPTPNPNFDPSNPLVVFVMDCVAGAGGLTARTIGISSEWTRLGTPASNQFFVYTTETGTNKKPTQEAVRMDASVTVAAIPAPGSLAILGLGGLVAGRRRR